MPTDHRTTLANIKRFDQLIVYLRDEMGWPITRDSFDDADDLFYDFTPEELGIDAKNAAKIQEIKRLRPLSIHQPWGIFFIKFEPKRLPVVALRRILNQVALKKRASANSAERAAWSADDLLFVSNYGEGEVRQISFAHFSQNVMRKDLPTLKVLGWDNLDTGLHLDHVADQLTERLAWPDDESNVERWRAVWRSAFTLRHHEVITTSREMALRLAELARAIRDRINTVLAIETENGPVTKLMEAFKKALVHDLDKDGFADMYAQTIAYGLLSARAANPSGETADDLAAAMPVTNPFLKELMETFLRVGGRKGKVSIAAGMDFDELGVSEVVELLDSAKMEEIVRDFGDRNPQEDPVIHFYELFLKEYDAKKRIQRGVFYTPRPVVSFIVRSVDELVRSEFGLEDGLADTTTWGEMVGRFDDLEIPEGATPDQAFVQILDPATGTGTFLVEVIGLIHKTMTERWQAEGHGAKKIEKLWNDYVPKDLLPRLHGYELMMSPYAIAHMKIGLKLYETGYRFGSDERARVYLTNALEPPQDFSGTLAFAIPALAREAKAVNAIKRDQRFTVVIGNPPYANFGKLNRIPFILNLLKDYKRGLNEKKLNLDDDFIKFMRLSQYVIRLSGTGVHGMVTNNVFIDGITHRRMRESLLSDSALCRILDLHGNVAAKERSPDGSVDSNVFKVKQGVSIALFVFNSSPGTNVAFGELFGTGEEKCSTLSQSKLSDLCSQELAPVAPAFLLSFRDITKDSEYSQYFSITDVFEDSAYGIQTKRDAFTIDYDKGEIMRRVEDILTLDDEVLREKYHIGRDGPSWSISWARADVARLEDPKDNLQQVFYRPFDVRWTLYTGRSRGFLGRPRKSMACMLSDNNIGLICMRQVFQDVNIYSHFGVTRHLIDERAFYSNRGGTYLFPLYKSHTGKTAQDLFSDDVRRVNISNAFTRALGSSLGIEVDPINGKLTGIIPELLLNYIYAVLWSSGYRTRYKENLKRDYPRLPLPGGFKFFQDLVRCGDQLVHLHLLESPKLDDHTAMLIGSGDFHVEKVSYADEIVWIDKAKTHGFRGVPEDVWNFHIGGYQVCEKWLKDREAKGGKNPRPGRVLTDEDTDHYQKIVVALSETMRIMEEIDEVIKIHGGWPDAFRTGD